MTVLLRPHVNYGSYMVIESQKPIFIYFSGYLLLKIGDQMTTKLSRLYGMDIFTDTGKFLGNAQDFIVDVETGEISRVLLEQLPGSSKDDAKKVLREKSVMYKNVKSVEDVIVVTKTQAGTSPDLG